MSTVASSAPGRRVAADPRSACGRRKRPETDELDGVPRTIVMFALEDKVRRLPLRFERLSPVSYAFKTLAYTMIDLRHRC